jgi:predicted permease
VSGLRAWLYRLAGTFSRRREREFAEELESHLAMHTSDNVRAGMSEGEARRQAVLKLGSVEATRLAYRDRSLVPLLEHAAHDVRFAVRQLRRNPAFTGAAIFVLGLGMTAAVALFGFVDAALLQPLPYPAPHRLVNVTETVAHIPRANLSYLDYLDWKQSARTLASLDVHNGTGRMLATPTGAVPVPAARVSAGFFRTLGVVPALGRDFRPEEEHAGAARVAIFTHETWQKRFGGRPDIVGEPVTLDGAPYTVVGVLPAGFHFALRGRAEVWTPIDPAGSCERARICHNLTGVGRLAEGVPVQAAQADLQAIAARLEQQYPDSNRGQGAIVEPLAEVIVGNVRPTLLMLFGGASLLLLIAGINVASLLLARADSRQRELALRRALGASRARLAAQFLAEGATLALLGTVAGVAAGHWAMALLVRLIPPDVVAGMPYLRDLGLTARGAAFAGAAAFVAAVLFALAPALRMAGSAMREGMAEGGRTSAGRTWRRLGSRLVVVELATAVVLLVGAGLLGRSVQRLLRVDLWFEPRDLASLDVVAPRARYADAAAALRLGRDTLAQARTVPGVASVALTSVLPVTFNGNTDWIRFVGRPFHGEHNEVNQRTVTPDYFTTLGATLLRGRHFREDDDASKPRVTIINQTLARLYFPDEDPLGKRFGDLALTPDSIKEIVGVVADIREGPLDTDIWPAVYYAFNQDPQMGMALVARTLVPPESVLPALAASVRRLDADLGVVGETTIEARIADSPAAYLRRSAAWLVGGFAAVALVLGVVGLYGVMAYLVSQRTREIGVRMALGARRESVHRLIVREAGALAGAGIVAGLLGAVGIATLLRRLLFATPPWHVPTLVVVSATLAVAALLASYLPARRAAGVDPIEALRAE